MENSLSAWQREFAQRHRLPPAYLDHARLWFDPVAGELALHQKRASRPVLMAVNGCQGSGKTTICDYLSTFLRREHGMHVMSLSLDDFYLSRDARRQLAADVHPLLVTRGVPGTHDMGLLAGTLDRLLAPGGGAPVAIPRFDKAIDDRLPEPRWESVSAPVDMVLLEGWCMGARPQTTAELARPVNKLEREEDSAGRWRGCVNEALRRDFLPLYRRVDQWLMLRAPSFECVYHWRLEQEQKLAADASGRDRGDAIMNEQQLARFIQHYERLTRQCLSILPPLVEYLVTLDAQRRVTGVDHGGSVPG